MLEAAGYPDKEGALLQVAGHLKVPHQTLSRWGRAVQNPPPPGLVHEKRIDFLEAIREELEGIFPALKERRIEATYRELATAAGIMLDKYQLLSGKPTGAVAIQVEYVNDWRSEREPQD